MVKRFRFFLFFKKAGRGSGTLPELQGKFGGAQPPRRHPTENSIYFLICLSVFCCVPPAAFHIMLRRGVWCLAPQSTHPCVEFCQLGSLSLTLSTCDGPLPRTLVGTVIHGPEPRFVGTTSQSSAGGRRLAAVLYGQVRSCSVHELLVAIVALRLHCLIDFSRLFRYRPTRRGTKGRGDRQRRDLGTTMSTISTMLLALIFHCEGPIIQPTWDGHTDTPKHPDRQKVTTRTHHYPYHPVMRTVAQLPRFQSHPLDAWMGTSWGVPLQAESWPVAQHVQSCGDRQPPPSVGG